MDDITRARWQKIGMAADHKAIDALRAALADAESGKLDAKHIIVIYTSNKTDTSKEDSVGWYQAGPLEHFAQVGLLDTAKFIMNNDYGV